MRILWAIMMSLPLALSACSSDDAAKPEEPVAPAADDSAAPAAPDAPAAEGAAAPSPEAPGGDPASATEPPPASDTETVGELTESSSPGEIPPTAPVVDEAPMPSDSDLAQAPQTKKERGARGRSVTRVVTASKLNVRSGPSRKAGVVRQLSKGEEVEAVVQGKFAKIGEGEYVRTKYLSPKGKGTKGKGKKAKSKAKKAKKKAKKTTP